MTIIGINSRLKTLFRKRFHSAYIRQKVSVVTKLFSSFISVLLMNVFG